MNYLRADWPAPAVVHTCLTTRAGGVSTGPWRGLNLGDHVGDRSEDVNENRRRLHQALALPAEPVWLRQVHGDTVVDLDRTDVDPTLPADGSVAGPGSVCAVLTADCLPLLICDRQGTRVAALHGGWRGLAGGIIEAGVRAIGVPATDLLVWLGPAIGPDAFEVGDEVRQVFITADPQASTAFVPSDYGKWRADIWQLARLRLRRLGITQVFGGGLCTWSDRERFYSFRRDHTTGRMASLIWLQHG